MKRIAISFYSKMVIVIFIGMLAWWFFITFNNLQNTTQNYLYGVAQGILPLIAGIFGLGNAHKWGMLKSSMGKALLFLSLGLITWGIGTIIFGYYNIFLQVAVPYPSVADGFYIISWPLWVISMFNLSKATGVKFQLSNIVGRAILFVIPIFTVAISYYILIIVARAGVITTQGDSVIKMFFDLAYPIGDIFILTTTLLIYGLSFNYLGGFFKLPIILILFGFLINYFGDFFFVYATTKGTYFVADWIDLLYTAAFFFLGIGACLMDPHTFAIHSNEK